MSKLSDYSKFDNLNSDNEDEPQEQNKPVAVMRPHPTIPRRFVFEYDNSTVYEFEQSLTEVVLYVSAPPHPVDCTISPNHLKLGLRNANTFFINEDTYEKVNVSESTWCYEDDDNDKGTKKIVVYLHKMAKGLVWERALKGRFYATIDPMSLQNIQKDMTIERWQEENPGMDFRNAEFNGNVPNPRTYMGGVRYD